LEIPPPSGAQPSPPAATAAADDDSAGRADGVPEDVRAPGGAWALAWVSVGCGVLLLVCAGGAAALLATALGEAERDLAARTQRTRAEKESAGDALVILDALADRVRRDATSELPESLSGPPPADPWRTPVAYRRVTPTRATLTSAGPDREFGTDDDVERSVRLE
jgi:hypothetical protein